MKDVECPYCGHPQDINHDDGYGYSESEIHNQQCSNCDKYFTFTTSISFYYEVGKADCLNGSNHNWEPTITYPKCFIKMHCPDCGQEREPTKEEKELYQIPDYEF